MWHAPYRGLEACPQENIKSEHQKIGFGAILGSKLANITILLNINFNNH